VGLVICSSAGSLQWLLRSKCVYEERTHKYKITFLTLANLYSSKMHVKDSGPILCIKKLFLSLRNLIQYLSFFVFSFEWIRLWNKNKPSKDRNQSLRLCFFVKNTACILLSFQHHFLQYVIFQQKKTKQRNWAAIGQSSD